MESEHLDYMRHVMNRNWSDRANTLELIEDFHGSRLERARAMVFLLLGDKVSADPDRAAWFRAEARRVIISHQTDSGSDRSPSRS